VSEDLQDLTNTSEGGLVATSSQTWSQALPAGESKLVD